MSSDGWGAAERRDEARCEGVGLHVVDPEQGDLPRDREALCRVEAGGEGGAHAGTAAHGDEIGSALLGVAATDRDGGRGWRSIFGDIREREEALGNQATKTALVGVEGREGVDPAVLAVIGRYFLMEMESCRGTIWDAIVLFENGYRGVVTARYQHWFKHQAQLRDREDRP